MRWVAKTEARGTRARFLMVDMVVCALFDGLVESRKVDMCAM